MSLDKLELTNEPYLRMTDSSEKVFSTISSAGRKALAQFYTITDTIMQDKGELGNPRCFFLDKDADVISQIVDNEAHGTEWLSTRIGAIANAVEAKAYLVIAEAWASAFDTLEEAQAAHEQGLRASKDPNRRSITLYYLESVGGDSIVGISEVKEKDDKSILGPIHLYDNVTGESGSLTNTHTGGSMSRFATHFAGHLSPEVAQQMRDAKPAVFDRMIIERDEDKDQGGEDKPEGKLH